jgi:purine-nucleoside phosphorylase
MLDQIASTTKFIRTRTNSFYPTVGIILGTGLGGLVEEVKIKFKIPYSEIPNFPISTVEGHPGNLIFGSIGNKNVIAMQGRFHFYEGYSMAQISFPVRIMKALGVETLIVSNASGGMNPNFKVGEIMLITDHINFFPTNPLIGKNYEALGPRFVDLAETYSKRLIKLAKQIAESANISISEGVYVGLTGPCFETPAEYRFLWRMGADAVGMSTVPEVIVAKHAGMEVFGISIISDLGIDGQVEKVSHEEIQKVARIKEPLVALIVKELVKKLA